MRNKNRYVLQIIEKVPYMDGEVIAETGRIPAA